MYLVCYFCDDDLNVASPLARKIRLIPKTKAKNPKIWGYYCSECCANSDIAGPIFRKNKVSIIRLTTKDQRLLLAEAAEAMND